VLSLSVQDFFLSNLNAKFVVFKWGFASMEGCSFDFSTTWFMMGNEYCSHLVCDSVWDVKIQRAVGFALLEHTHLVSFMGF
jgi:hypothetical protein